MASFAYTGTTTAPSCQTSPWISSATKLTTAHNIASVKNDATGTLLHGSVMHFIRVRFFSSMFSSFHPFFVWYLLRIMVLES
jgi:hypothetical protein